jgi:hypothetical protein
MDHQVKSFAGTMLAGLFILSERTLKIKATDLEKRQDLPA